MENEIIGITTIEKLVEKLEKDSTKYLETIGTYNGSYEVLRKTYLRCKKKGIEDIIDREFISGMIWGLYASHFITEREKDCLAHSLTAIGYGEEN